MGIAELIWFYWLLISDIPRRRKLEREHKYRMNEWRHLELDWELIKDDLRDLDERLTNRVQTSSP